MGERRSARGAPEEALTDWLPAAAPRLAEIKRKPIEGFSAGPQEDNMFKWDIMIMGPPGCAYEGGMFKATMDFPSDYPNMPPTLKITSEFWHPNVHADGKVCISILHPPGDDPHQYETAAERWRPIHTIESVLISVISMISSPNPDSPANVDAAKMFRDDPDAYRKKCRRLVEKSQENAFD